MIVAMSDSAASTSVARLSLGALFFGFLKVGLSGFGGVMPFFSKTLCFGRDCN